MIHERNFHILVVDDEPGYQELLRRILAPAGYPVVMASNANEAMQSVTQSPPAVAVLDIRMPGQSGLWLASQIHAVSPHTGVVFATADQAVPAIETLRRGTIAYVTKPFRHEEVLAAVQEAVRWWAAESGEAVPVPVLVAAPSPAARPLPVPVEREYPASRHWRQEARTRRRTRLAIAAAVVAVGIAIAVAVLRPDTGGASASVLAHVVDSAGMVVVYDGNGKSVSQGSGFFVEADTFVTSRHVVDGGLSAKIVVGSAEYRVAGVSAIDLPHDLALLKTTAPSEGRLQLAQVLPAIGDAVYVYGAPRGLAGTLAAGIVSRVGASGAMLQITAPISPGSSGSPVLNQAGEVVGVVVSSNQEGQALNFAAPADYVRALLAEQRGVRPLVVASRGVADDRERHELVGPVQSVTLFSEEPAPEMLERLTAQYQQTMPMGAARRRAQQDVLAASRTTLLFDRTERLVERRSGDGSIQTAGALLDPPAKTSPITLEEHDVTGNVAHRVYADGSDVTFRYQLDARGNWVSREATRKDPKTGLTSVSTSHRQIDYWD